MTTRTAVALVSVVAMSATAFAQGEKEEEEETTRATPPSDEEEPPGGSEKKKKDSPEPASVEASASTEGLVEVGAPKGRVTLPGGGFMFSAIVEMNMAKGAAGKPLGVAPDLWIGLADRLTVGLYHSGRAATGFLTSFGTGLCFRGGGMGGGMGMSSNPCKLGLGDIYTFGGGELRIGLTEGGFATALMLGGNATFLESEKLFAGKAGILARVHAKRVAIELAPSAAIGLNKRSDFERDTLFVPVTIYIRFATRVSLALQGGITSTFKKFGDNYRVPAAAGLSIGLGQRISFDAAFGLAAVADKNDMTKAFDQRSVTVGLTYAQ